MAHDAQDSNGSPTDDGYDVESLVLQMNAARQQGIMPYRLAFLSRTHENRIKEIISFPYLSKKKVVVNIREYGDPMTLTTVEVTQIAPLTPHEELVFRRGGEVPFRSAE